MGQVHVYGVVPTGLRKAPEGAELVEHRDVAAIVGPVGAAQGAKLLREHWRILEDAGKRTTVLPLRFGTVVEAGEVAEGFLAPAHDELRARLEELEGKVQLTVKAFYDEEALMRSVVEASPAISSLRERIRGVPEAAAQRDRIRLGELVAAQVERVRERDASALYDRLAPLAVNAVMEPVSRPDAAMAGAFLVERDRVDDFSAAVAKLGREVSGRMTLRYVGPLPPYSFVDEDVRRAAWA